MQLGSYKKPFIYAVAVHLLVLLVLSLNLDIEPRTVSAPTAPPSEVIQATAVDETKVQAEIDKLRAAERKQQQRQEAKQRVLEHKAQEAERKRRAEEERLVRLKKDREAQARKQQQEAKHLAELERKKQQEAEHLAALEKQKQQETERLAKLQAESRKAEDDKRRQAEAEARRKQIEEEERQLKAEQTRVEAATKARNREESLRYIAQMQAKVARNWINPLSGKSGLECVVRVRLNNEGKVLLAQVVQGSGNEVFDRSVEAAVLKASPLPLPKDPTIMEGFPELRFKFKPE